MKVYVITSGEYSDYHIVRVFAEKENAQKYIALMNKGRCIYSDDYYLEEYETDDDNFTCPETPIECRQFYIRDGKIWSEDDDTTFVFGNEIKLLKEHGTCDRVLIPKDRIKDKDENQIKKIVEDKYIELEYKRKVELAQRKESREKYGV